MTSKVQPSGDEIELFCSRKQKMADISLVLRVRTRRNYSEKHGKKSKNTTRRATSAIWKIFAELNHPKRALSKMNLTSMEVRMY